MTTAICASIACDLPVAHRDRCSKHYRRLVRRGDWVGRVDPTPAREHLMKLRDMGFGQRQIAKHTGLKQHTISSIMTGRTVTIMNTTERAILEFRGGVLGPRTLVDPTGTRRRLQALVAFGYTLEGISEHVGITKESVKRITWGQASVFAGTRDRVIEVYNELQMTPGPSSINRQRAKTKGWVVPFLWDEEKIDNPTARPLSATRA